MAGCVAARDYAWGLHDNGGGRGERKHKGKTHRYGQGYGELQKIGVLVDMDQHTLSTLPPPLLTQLLRSL